MLTVRRAGEDDIPGVLQIWAVADAEPSVTDDASGLRALLRHDAEALSIAEVDGAPVGTLIATWDGWRGHLYRLAVLPEHRRRGIARELVRTAERRLGTLGVRRLNAVVVDGRRPATGFWHAAGYEVTQRLRFVKNTA